MDNLWQREENIVAKGEIVRFEQFLLLSLYFQKAAAEASESVYMRERVKGSSHYMLWYINPFPHTTNLQQTTLKTLCQKPEKSLYIKVYLLTKYENIVAKVEIAHFEQLLLLSQCIQKSSAAGAGVFLALLARRAYVMAIRPSCVCKQFLVNMIQSSLLIVSQPNLYRS